LRFLTLLINDLKAEIYLGEINFSDLKILAIKMKCFYAIEGPFKITKFYGNGKRKNGLINSF